MNNKVNEKVILIVEDNPGDARLIREHILTEKLCFDTIHAASLSDACNLLSEHKVDAILLDLHLPDSSGLDTIKKIVSISPGIPVIVLTGLDDDELGAQAVRHGAQDYLVKNNLDGRILRKSLSYAFERQKMNAQIQIILNSTVDGVIIFDKNGKIRYQNFAAKIFSESCIESSIFTNFSELVWKQKTHDTLASSDVYLTCEVSDTVLNRTFELRRLNIDWEDKKDIALVYIHEITEQVMARDVLQKANIQLEESVNKRTAELQWANSALKTMGHCNSIISAASAEEEMLVNLCQQIVTNLNYPLVWIGFQDNSDNSVYKAVAWAGCDSDWFTVKQRDYQSIEKEFPAIVDCYHSGKAIIHNQENSTHYSLGMVLPLDLDGSKAILSFHAVEQNAFEYDESQLFNKLANDIAYGINSIRNQAERKSLQKQ